MIPQHGITNTKSKWDAASRILRTSLTGPVTAADVAEWGAGLHRELGLIPDGATFALLLNLDGFEPVSLDAHRAMRNVVPEILASHGMRPAFLDLFENQPEIVITMSRGVRCVAFANVHHDQHKMTRYERQIAKPDQRFFTDLSAAEAWLHTVI